MTASPLPYVLLSDGEKESQAAEVQLQEAGIPFTRVTTKDPGRSGRLAPQLYTLSGSIARLANIQAWISLQRVNGTRG